MSLNAADSNFADMLRPLLPNDTLRDADRKYLEESRGRFHRESALLALPRSVEEVAIIVKACASERVGLVPYGGGTGLVGGQVIPDGPRPLVLSLERMNMIRSVSAASGVIVAEAGCILADVQAASEAVDRLFPLSLAAQGSAQIGGNLSTNAGGLNVLRYGSARDLCLGLEAVLPNGEIWRGLSPLRKNNTGYDIKNLLIGSEGTLGVITAASLRLFSQPVAHETAMLAVPSVEAALALLSLAQTHFGETISAFELIARESLNFLQASLPDIRLPFSELPDWLVLIELGLPKSMAGQDCLTRMLQEALEGEIVLDGMIAMSAKQRDEFWAVRENIPAANRVVGSISSHDVSIPIERIPAFIDEGQAVVADIGPFRVNCFGHLGDGNLHFNVFPPAGGRKSDYRDLQAKIQHAVHDLVHHYGGSFSAEHGVGRLKTDDLKRYSEPVKYDTMHAVKTLLDPLGIMNPGAVFSAG
ncbi:FAD-binding oxidoreductase [Cognatishimia sp. WU-CL00825]|uniref:FAD-binding oxidoreductase n=1 Tax=Cognatishimia sp. WU-CL00825 TaxID=3127658 RepID=UPI0031096DF5